MTLHIQYQIFTHWLHLHPQFGGIAAFLIAFSESIALIGTIIPGSVTMTAIGVMAGSGVLPIWSVIIFSIFGAMMGDGLSYVLGYYFKNRLEFMWPFSKHPQIIRSGEDFIYKHGGKSVFIGRFVGAVRAIIPVIAGMLKMPPKRYFLASIPSAIVWAPIYMLPGILLGAASLEMPAHVAAELIVFVLLILVAAWFFFWMTQWIYRKTKRYCNSILDQKWALWRLQPSKRWICFLLKNGEHPKTHGQLLIAIFSLILAVLFVLLTIKVTLHGPLITSWNNTAYHLFRGMRTPLLDKVMLYVTFLGDPNVLLPLLPIVTLWLLFNRRFFAAIHWIIVICGSLSIAWIIRHLFYSIRPAGIFLQKTSSSFPSGHVIVSIAIYGFIAFLLAYKKPKPIRKTIYWSAFILCFAIAISRLYLLAHWLTDILGGILLSGAFVYGGVVSYRRTKNTSLKITGILTLTIMTIFIGFFIQCHLHYKTYLKNSQPFWATQYIHTKDWWNQKSSLIPLYRKNRFGHPSELLNIEWVGTLPQIQTALLQHGWSNIMTQSYFETLEKILEERNQSHRSFIAKLYQDQDPVLLMVKFINKNSPPLILHLWQSNIQLMPDNKPLWVGTLYFDIQSKFHFLFWQHRKMIAQQADTFYFLLPPFAHLTWQTKVIPAGKLPRPIEKDHRDHHILLIKPY